MLSSQCNPTIGFWDPIGLATANNMDNEKFIGWLRHSEIKHGRVAMVRLDMLFLGARRLSNAQTPVNPFIRLSLRPH